MRAYDQSLWVVLGGVHFLTRKGRDYAYACGAGLHFPGCEDERVGDTLREAVARGNLEPMKRATRYATRILREHGLVDANEVTVAGIMADVRGEQSEARLLAEIEECHPIGPDGKPWARVRTVEVRNVDADDVPRSDDPERGMVAPYVYRETCVSVGASGELGAGDTRITWQARRV